MRMTHERLVQRLEEGIHDPTRGLPDPVFRLVSSITAMVNVDLLIRNARGQTLLTWRDDGRWSGWHVPGGIIRYKEKLADRVHAVAAGELGTTVRIVSRPLAVNEIIHPEWKTRGHFISFLFECRLTGKPDPALRYLEGRPQAGQWAWHDGAPADLIGVHEMYRTFLNGGRSPLRGRKRNCPRRAAGVL